MKRLILAMTIISLPLLADDSFYENLEPLNVVRIEQRGNFMPTIGRGISRSVVTTLKINVASGGCTDENSFHLTTDKKENVQVITIRRIKEDRCDEYFPNGVTVKLQTVDLNPFHPIVVNNPLLVKQFISH